jgi:hypothetical protein
MKLPPGRLLRSRVVSDPRTALMSALERGVTGYGVFEPQGSLLLDEAGEGVLTFEAGVPVVAYHTGTDRGGPHALADLAASGPYRLELFSLAAADMAAVHDLDALRVPPGMPAKRLAGDQVLADRTRAVAPQSVLDRLDGSEEVATGDSGGDRGAVSAFLDDEAKIEAIREQARTEAEERAEQWGFDV